MGMTYEEFEWQILRLVYEDGLESLEPAYLAYSLGIAHETVTAYLEHAAESGLVDLDVGEEGQMRYRIPGVDRKRPLPTPLWKEAEKAAEAHDSFEQGSLERFAPEKEIVDRLARPVAGPMVSPVHDGLNGQVQRFYGGADGSTVATAGMGPILEMGARADSASAALVSVNARADLPFKVESTDESFVDPSQTVFMRQIRVHGVQSEEALQEHVQRMFESFGYRMVQREDDRVRFERGSVTFILALVPLFVLVIPLFVYLCLYCMGRSTIHQEPIELDVQFRRGEGPDPVFDIDLTYIGLHGVVLGAADQRVLNQEIDTLREELRWSLTPG
ncbi:MAG: hypothetical protein ACNA8W_08825 [Bradymonadaceae bacterium]